MTPPKSLKAARAYARACRRVSARAEAVFARHGAASEAVEALKRDPVLYLRRREADRLRLLLSPEAQSSLLPFLPQPTVTKGEMNP